MEKGADVAGFIERLGKIGFDRAGSCGRGVFAACMFAILGFCLAGASVAAASPISFTWSGQSKVTEDWSAPANWADDANPAPGEEIETLTFPKLTNKVCADELGSEPCYISFNDVSGLSAKSIQIDDADDYLIGGDELTIENEGLTASPEETGSAGDVIETPFNLSTSQTWHVDGRSGGELGENGLLLTGKVTGNGNALNVELSDGPLLGLVENDTEAGPVTIDGANMNEIAANGVVSLADAQLDSEDGEPVSLSHIFFAGSGAVGRLATSDSDMDIGSPDQGIEVTSAKLDAASHVEFNVTGDGATAQAEYSQLTSQGSIELGGSEVEVVVRPPKKGEACPELTAGQTYTFVSTSGTLSGSFSNAPEHGAEIPIRFAEACEQLSQKMRIAYHESGGVQTVTGTVEAEANELKEAKEKETREQESKEKEEALLKLEEEHAKLIAEEVVAKEAAVAVIEKRQEEEAATRRRQEEESIGSMYQVGETAATGSVSLEGSTINAQSNGDAKFKLACAGTGTCAGELTLTVKSTNKKGKTKRISTAQFSISAGKTATVVLKLDASGRALLAAAHGHLSAMLTILKSYPAPSQTHTVSVRLIQQRTHVKTKK